MGCKYKNTIELQLYSVFLIYLNKLFIKHNLLNMSERRGSNPRPSAWKANALSTELLSQYKKLDNIPLL